MRRSDCVVPRYCGKTSGTFSSTNTTLFWKIETCFLHDRWCPRALSTIIFQLSYLFYILSASVLAKNHWVASVLLFCAVKQLLYIQLMKQALYTIKQIKIPISLK